MAEKEEQKLGPNVTYQPEDESQKTPVSIGNVQFTPGKSVNLEERLGKSGSEALLKKLAGNPHFKVDGGEDWKAQAEKRSQAEQQDAEEAEKARETARKAEEAKVRGEAPPPPEDWKGPDEAGLETDSAARRPTIGRKDK